MSTASHIQGEIFEEIHVKKSLYFWGIISVDHKFSNTDGSNCLPHIFYDNKFLKEMFIKQCLIV
jgi:hypothetical protein